MELNTYFITEKLAIDIERAINIFISIYYIKSYNRKLTNNLYIYYI